MAQLNQPSLSQPLQELKQLRRPFQETPLETLLLMNILPPHQDTLVQRKKPPHTLILQVELPPLLTKRLQKDQLLPLLNQLILIPLEFQSLNQPSILHMELHT
jgi:hypothetical protein